MVKFSNKSNETISVMVEKCWFWDDSYSYAIRPNQEENWGRASKTYMTISYENLHGGPKIIRRIDINSDGYVEFYSRSNIVVCESSGEQSYQLGESPEEEINRLKEEMTQKLLDIEKINNEKQFENDDHLITQYQKQIDDKNEEMELLRGKLESQLTIITEKLEEENEKHEAKLNEVEQNFKKQLNQMTLDQLKTSLQNLNETKRVLTKAYRDNKKISDNKQKEFETLQTQYKDEANHIVEFHHERQDNSILNILLLGITGHGKSTFANRFYGDDSENAKKGPFAVGDSVQSETKLPKKEISQRNNNQKMSIIDTPGLLDTAGQDKYNMKNLIEYLRGINGINAFLVVKSMGEPRLDIAYQNMLSDLEGYLGKNFWEHVIFIATKAEKHDKDKLPNWCTEFRNEIKKLFNLNGNNKIKLPIIGMSNFDNYKNPIETLMKNIPKERYKCDALKSPIDDLKKKMDIASKEYKQMQLEVEDLELQLKSNQNQIEFAVGSLKKQGVTVENTSNIRSHQQAFEDNDIENSDGNNNNNDCGEPSNKKRRLQ